MASQREVRVLPALAPGLFAPHQPYLQNHATPSPHEQRSSVNSAEHASEATAAKIDRLHLCEAQDLIRIQGGF